MVADDTYNLRDEPIPPTWVLTVRKCTCGQTLYWDKEEGEWHCMKSTCPEYKSHVKKKVIPQFKIDKVIEFGEILTIKDIAGRLKLSEKDVFRILRENGIL